MAEKALQQLVDRFYQENEDILIHDQHLTAKGDFEYFTRLVALVYDYRTQENEIVDKQGEQSLPYMNLKLLTQI